jgi:CheY-like chemotaxis protein
MKLRIFIIDDEESIRETYQMHLEGLGHEVIALPDPSFCSVYMGAVCKVDNACADILIVDYSMPRMTGLRLLELMEKKGGLTAARFKMILTGDATQIDQDVAKRLGCEVRQKPMRLSELEEWVNTLAKDIPADRKLVDLSSIQVNP